MALDRGLDPYWSADPAAAGAAWIRGGFKGRGSKDFFCIDIQDDQDKDGFNRVKKGTFPALGNKSVYLFLS